MLRPPICVFSHQPEDDLVGGRALADSHSVSAGWMRPPTPPGAREIEAECSARGSGGGESAFTLCVCDLSFGFVTATCLVRGTLDLRLRSPKKVAPKCQRHGGIQE